MIESSTGENLLEDCGCNYLRVYEEYRKCFQSLLHKMYQSKECQRKYFLSSKRLVANDAIFFPLAKNVLYPQHLL